MKGSSEGLSHGTLNPCQLPEPLTEDPEGPGPTLDISRGKLDLLQIRGCNPVCTQGGWYLCLVSLHTVSCVSDGIELMPYFPYVFHSQCFNFQEYLYF